MLDQLFSSRTRVKLLKIFLSNPENDFFVRELTRLTDEQINSVRRELDNLKKIGFIKSRDDGNRKFFQVNQNFSIFEELTSIFTKAQGPSEEILSNILSCGDIDLISISGKLITRTESNLEILIVGDVKKEQVQNFLKKLEEDRAHQVRYAIFTREDFMFRLKCRDKFIENYFKKEKYVVIYDKIMINKFI